MVLRRTDVLAIVVAVTGLSGCIPPREPVLPAQPRGLVCDRTTATVTSVGRATAALYAEQSVRQQAQEVRGDMIRGGLRRVRMVHARTHCAPTGWSSLTTCTTVARLCGQ